MTEHTASGAGDPAAREFTARSADDAIRAGLDALGLAPEEAGITVLDEGSRGFLGLGAREARVRIEPRRAGAAAVEEMTREVLRLMGIEGTVDATRSGTTILVRIAAGQHDGLLIGRKGETLHALEHLLLRMAARRLDLGEHARVDVDIAGYRKRREEQLEKLAHDLAERVERTGRRAMTEPLPPGERRIVHRALGGHQKVEAHAAGSGLLRRIVITPPRPRREADAR